VLATLVLWALIGRQGSAGLTLPGHGIPTTIAMLWEAILTLGLVSVILGTASGAQQVGPLAAIGVGAYIALAGLWGWPVSGASMNPARSLGPGQGKRQPLTQARNQGRPAAAHLMQVRVAGRASSRSSPIG